MDETYRASVTCNFSFIESIPAATNAAMGYRYYANTSDSVLASGPAGSKLNPAPVSAAAAELRLKLSVLVRSEKVVQ